MSSKRKYGSSSKSSSRSRKRVRYSAMVSKVSVPAILRSRASELKTIDVGPATATVNSSGALALLNGIQEGAASWNRIGRKVCMKSLRFTGELFMTTNNANLNFGDYIRILLIYDRQPNGALPSVGDILSNVDQTGSVTVTSYAGINMVNSERFAILRDKRIAIPAFNASDVSTVFSANNSSLTGLNEPSFNFDMYVKLRDLETHYKSSSSPSTVADISTGSLLLLTYGVNSAAASCFRVNYTTRLRFLDT